MPTIPAQSGRDNAIARSGAGTLVLECSPRAEISSRPVTRRQHMPQRVTVSRLLRTGAALLLACALMPVVGGTAERRHAAGADQISLSHGLDSEFDHGQLGNGPIRHGRERPMGAGGFVHGQHDGGDPNEHQGHHHRSSTSGRPSIPVSPDTPVLLPGPAGFDRSARYRPVAAVHLAGGRWLRRRPYSFAVFGDWGQAYAGGVNADQTNVLQQISQSGARFAVMTGDTAYPGGGQKEYGDLKQAGRGHQHGVRPDLLGRARAGRSRCST